MAKLKWRPVSKNMYGPSTMQGMMASIFTDPSVPGLWWKFGEVPGNFQDGTNVNYSQVSGQTPVYLPGQGQIDPPIGFSQDKKNGLKYGPELLVNGDFSNGLTGWTAIGLTATVANNEVTATALGGGSSLEQNVSWEVGKAYELTTTIKADAANALANSARIVTMANALFISVHAVTSNGSYQTVRAIISPTSNVNPLVSFGVASTVDYGAPGDKAYFRAISLREVVGLHAQQATSPARPAFTGLINILAQSEQLSDPAWAKNFVTVTANKVVPTVDNNLHYVAQGMTLPNSTKCSISLSAAAAGYSWVGIECYTGEGFLLTSINVATGELGGVSAGALVSTPVLQDGLWRCSVSMVTAATGAPRFTIFPSSADGAFTYAGNGIDGVIITKVQVNVGEPTSYQRTGAPNVYDTSGFPLSAKFDGADDGLATAPFPAGTLSDNMDCFIAYRRNTADRAIVASQDTGTGIYWFHMENGDPAGSSQGIGTTTTYAVSGVAVSGIAGPGNTTPSAAQLHAAVPVGGFCILECHNMNLAALTALSLSMLAGYRANANIREVILCPAQTPTNRQVIRKNMGLALGLSL